MIRKKLAFFAEEALKISRTFVRLSPIELDKFTSFHVSVLLCLSCKKQTEKRQRLVVNVITVENDLRRPQFLDGNFFRIAARSIKYL